MWCIKRVVRSPTLLSKSILREVPRRALAKKAHGFFHFLLKHYLLKCVFRRKLHYHAVQEQIPVDIYFQLRFVKAPQTAFASHRNDLTVSGKALKLL